GGKRRDRGGLFGREGEPPRTTNPPPQHVAQLASSVSGGTEGNVRQPILAVNSLRIVLLTPTMVLDSAVVLGRGRSVQRGPGHVRGAWVRRRRGLGVGAQSAQLGCDPPRL